jgi:glyoxylase-like metal-dependent hydrolase (beta-lactamase superfamily II)
MEVLMLLVLVRRLRTLATVVGLALIGISTATVAAQKPMTPLRMYVIDCGNLGGANPLAMVAYLIVHPRGSLLWEAGGLPDNRIESGGSTEGLLSFLQNATSAHTLRSQLQGIGYSPGRITYFATSHYHADHSANANDYRGSIWLVQRAERDAMFAAGPPPRFADPSFYSALKDAKAFLLDGDHDVFGDGQVVVKAAPGHTPGHQTLFVNLAKTGKILLGGDLYHSSAEHENHVPPPAYDTNPQQDAESRAKIEKFLQQTGTTLWINHDLARLKSQRIAPAYYE